MSNENPVGTTTVYQILEEMAIMLRECRLRLDRLEHAQGLPPPVPVDPVAFPWLYRQMQT